LTLTEYKEHYQLNVLPMLDLLRSMIKAKEEEIEKMKDNEKQREYFFKKAVAALENLRLILRAFKELYLIGGVSIKEGEIFSQALSAELTRAENGLRLAALNVLMKAP